MLDILVVDDDPAINQLLARALRTRGHRVSLASNGLRALEAAQAQHLDLVLCDLRLPGLDGLTCLSRLRAVHPETLAILMSAQTDLHTVVAARGVKDVGVLTKPFSVVALVQRIDALDSAIASSAGATH
jgi:DNA-binding response OmpR family regulator